MGEHGSRILILNAAAAPVQDSYEAHESLADWLQVPIEEIHRALAAGQVSSLLDEEAYPTLDQIMEHILYIESAEQRKLSSLVHEDGYRIYILVQIEDCHHELLMALYGLVAAYSQSFPNILCMQISQDSVPGFEVTSEVDIVGFLTKLNIPSMFHSTPAREEIAS